MKRRGTAGSAAFRLSRSQNSQPPSESRRRLPPRSGSTGQGRPAPRPGPEPRAGRSVPASGRVTAARARKPTDPRSRHRPRPGHPRRGSRTRRPESCGAVHPAGSLRSACRGSRPGPPRGARRTSSRAFSPLPGFRPGRRRQPGTPCGSASADSSWRHGPEPRTSECPRPGACRAWSARCPGPPRPAPRRQRTSRRNRPSERTADSRDAPLSSRNTAP